MATGSALIVAIGSQNTFVLRSGVLRSHVLPIVTICALSDALLIVAGIAGASALVRCNTPFWIRGSHRQSDVVFGGPRLAWAKPPVYPR